MNKTEKQILKNAIDTRKKNLNIMYETFGYDSTEVFIVKSEIELLENLFKNNNVEAPFKKRKPRKDKGKRRSNANAQKLMYIKRDGDLFIQLNENADYVKVTDSNHTRVLIDVFDYRIEGTFVGCTLSGINLTNWRIERK